MTIFAKTSLAVRSMEYWGCLHCERDIGVRLSGGGGHEVVLSMERLPKL